MNYINGYNYQKIKVSNRNLLLKYIIMNEHLSRTDLANMTGLTKMTVSNIISELIQNHIVTESKNKAENGQSTIGRKPLILELSPESPCIVGMYLSHEYCYTVLSDLKANILYSRKAKLSQDETGESLVAKLLDPYYYIQKAYKRRLLGIGIASIGQTDSKKGTLLNTMYFDNIKNFNICSAVHGATDLPVFLDNASKVSGFAEKTFGVGKKYKDFIYVGISDSIGMGIISNGKLYENNSGLYGELGHMSINMDGPKCYCGNSGCLEQYAGISNVVNRACQDIRFHKDSSLWGTVIEWIDIIEAAMGNDRFAVEIIDEFCKYISVALANVINILGPEMIVIGDEAAIGGELIRKKLEILINQRAILPNKEKIPVLISAFKDKAPIIGSISLVIRKILGGRLQLY